MADHDGQAFHKAVMVHVRPLDAVIKRGVAIRTVKIDVQGFECHVVAGGRATLEGVRQASLLKTEISGRHLRGQNCSAGKLYDLLKSIGYQLEPAEVPVSEQTDVVARKPGVFHDSLGITT